MIFRVSILFTVSLGLALSIFSQTATGQEASPDVQVPDTADAVVQVNGMACSACAQRMKSTLEGVEGVTRATVLLEEQSVVLTLGGKSAPTEQILREAVTSAGYEFRTAVFAEGRTKEASGG